jgi:lysophospholipase L1-like esterase
VSATPELKKSLESGQRIFYPVDGHPTAEGHDAIAAALFPVVLEMLRSGSL